MRELLDEHERSGLSLKAFAAAAKVPYTTISWWRARLRSRASSRFVPVRVREEPRSVEIVVGDVVVRVADADEHAVARLVRALAVRALRQERAKPETVRIAAVLERLAKDALPRSPLGEAVTVLPDQPPRSYTVATCQPLASAYAEARRRWCSGLSPRTWSSVDTLTQIPTALMLTFLCPVPGNPRLPLSLILQRRGDTRRALYVPVCRPLPL
jgi:hypothetical protein